MTKNGKVKVGIIGCNFRLIFIWRLQMGEIAEVVAVASPTREC